MLQTMLILLTEKFLVCSLLSEHGPLHEKRLLALICRVKMNRHPQKPDRWKISRRSELTYFNCHFFGDYCQRKICRVLKIVGKAKAVKECDLNGGGRLIYSPSILRKKKKPMLLL